MKYVFRILFLFFIPVLVYPAEYIIQSTSGNFFTPSNLTINVGDTVTWMNAGGFHNVIEDNNLFSSGSPSSSAWQFSYVFSNTGSYGYYCSVHGAPGGVGMSGTIAVQNVVGIEEDAEHSRLKQFEIEAVYPNPFNPVTRFQLDINKAGRYNLKIFNMAGQQVYARNYFFQSGKHTISWNAVTNSGRSLPGGNYFYHLSNGLSAISGKLLLLK